MSLAPAGPFTCLWLITSLVLFLSVGCEGEPNTAEESASGAPSVPGYLALHDTLFVPSCASGSCHGGPIAVAELSFDDAQQAYERLLGGEPLNPQALADGLSLVTPGSLESSYLYLKLAHHGEDLEALGYGSPMPLGQPPVSAEALEALAAWIQGGAPLRGGALTLEERSAEPDESDYVSCDAEDEEGLMACLGPAPDAGEYLRLYTPPLTLPAGSEVVMCSYVAHAEEAIRLKAARGKQMSGGHHAAVFVGLMAPSVEGPRPCGEIEMGSLRFVAGAGGAGGQDTEMPAGAALTIAKGQRIVIQSHYINLSPEPRVVMDAVDLELTSLEESPIDVDAFAVVDSDLAIPPGVEGYEREKTCEIDAPMELHMMLGHTHDYGVRFDLEVLREGLPELLYHATHGPTLRDTPDITMFDEPLRLEAGDVLRMTCGWTNTTDATLGWPEEMCVGLMYYSPGRGYLICDTEDTFPVVQDGGAPSDLEGCVQPGEEGNALGVGRYCSVGGGECDETPEPTLCLAEFNSDAPYCSVILCQDDSVCGEGASCVFEGAGSACVPLACQ